MAKRALTVVKKEETLTREAFERLFACLDDDRELAAEKYEQIRQALITFFEFRGSATPLDYADETINRVARRLSEGREIFTAKPVNYFYAVARNVWRERLARPVTTVPLSDELPSDKTLTADPYTIMERDEEQQALNRKLACLERCLQNLSPEDRELIIRYYEGDGGDKIENRKRLAASLGIPLNALRIRACRLRDKLETCMNQCLKETD